jgi:hypothetical protein
MMRGDAPDAADESEFYTSAADPGQIPIKMSGEQHFTESSNILSIP